MSDEAVCFAPAVDLAAALAAGDVGVGEILEVFLERIARVNPALNAIISIDADAARATAARLDSVPATARGPLHGIPMAIKDLAQTRGLRTTMGSPIYADFVPDQDDLFVARLRDAGAVIIGKTNTPEFGAGSQTFNPVFGATRNPWNTARTCGGSSGGAAVALAARMLPLADGSDLGGSLRNPASFCNVVGFRPSPGRVPSWPRQFSSDPLAVLGPMARSVPDLALLLSVMAGPDPRVPISLPDPGTHFLRALTRDFGGARLAFSPDLGRYPVAAEVISVLEQNLPVFADLGASLSRAAPDLSDADEIFQTLRAWSFVTRARDDYERHGAHMKDTLRWNIEQGMALTATQVADAEVKRSALNARMAAFFDDYDFLLCTAAQVVPFDIEQPWVTTINGQELPTYLDWMAVCYAITVTGHPAISVPAGFTSDGLPVGLQIVGRRWDDFGVMQLAHAFAGITDHAATLPPDIEA